MLWIGLPLVAIAGLATQFEFHQPARPGQPPSGGATTASAQYIEDLPGVRTGVVTRAQRLANTSIMNRSLERGAQLRLRAGSRVEIESSLRLGTGAAIIGDSETNKPTIFMPADSFDNTNDVAGEGRYGPNAVGIDFSGELSGAFRASNGVRIENIRLLSEQKTGRRLRGIVGRNVTNCVLRNVEISGLPLGIGVALASARGCRVIGIRVHDFADDTAWKLLPQSTGIEIDNDIVRNTPSSDTLIEQFRIERLLVGGALLSKWGYQTDGINIVNSASRVQIANGRISDVGEGIDIFGSDGTVENVTINNAYIFGLKFVHGASRNLVRNVTISNAGLAGVNFAGSNSALQDTAENIVSGLKIENIDSFGRWRQNSTAGILVSGRNARRVPRGNQVIDAEVDLGSKGKYGWLDQSTGAGNRGLDVDIRGGPSLDRPVLILYGGGSVRQRRVR